MQNKQQNIEKAKSKLKEYWGYDSFRTGQGEAIEAILKGHDTLVLFPTGGGKSLCYQVPATIYEGITLVISPLVALMQDQVEQLHRAGIRSSYINSTIPSYEVEQRLINARNGMYKLLYLAPERLETALWQNMALDLHISLVAVDEAHCISQWGHDFRPSYRSIRTEMEKLPSDPAWMALTATATPEVRDDIIENLEFKKPVIVASGFKRPNLLWWVSHTDQKKTHVMKAVQRGVKKGSGIIYAGTRKDCERIADWLGLRKIEAKAYHAGMSGEERQAVQRGWLDGIFPVVVATNAFGMGIDKPDCRFVIHYEMPFTLEAYYQEAGRAGRDGKEAYPVLIYKKTDYHKAKSRLLRSYPDLDQLSRLYDAIYDEFSLAVGSRQEEPEPLAIDSIRKRSKLNRSEINAGMKVLERLELLEIVNITEPQLGVQFIVNRQILRERIDKSRPLKREFLDTLYRQYGPEAFNRKYYLELPYLMEKLNVNRNELIKAIHVLADQDHLLEFHLIVEVPLIYLPEHRMGRLPADRAEVEGYRNILLKKLDRMKSYAETKSCREVFLRVYFGEKNVTPCGKCDRCTESVQIADHDSFNMDDLTVLREHLNTPASLKELIEATGLNRNKLKSILRYLILEQEIMKSENNPDKFVRKK